MRRKANILFNIILSIAFIVPTLTSGRANALQNGGYSLNLSNATYLSPPHLAYTWGYISCLIGMNCSLTKSYGSSQYFFRDIYGYDIKNCTSYVANRVAELTSINVSNLGNGGSWYDMAPLRGFIQKSTPEPGDAAVWPGNPGHVAFVESVNPNGTVNISEYNIAGTGEFGMRYNVANVSHYVDFNGVGTPVNTAYRPPLTMVTDVGASGVNFVHLKNTATSFSTTTVTNVPGWGFSGLKPFKGDFNKDGYTDVATVNNLGAGGVTIAVSLNYGTGLSAPTVWLSLPSWGWSGIKPVALDYNHDGFTDFGAIIDVGGGNSALAVANSSGTSFAGPVVVANFTGFNFAALKYTTGDFNHDTWQDITILRDFTSFTNVATFLNTGVGFTLDNNHSVNLWSWLWGQLTPLAGDFDGNGWSDIGYMRQTSVGGVEYDVELNTGVSFLSPIAWQTNNSWGYAGMKPFSGNYNADIWGVTDFGSLNDIGAGGTSVAFTGSTGSGLVASSIWLTLNGWGWSGIKLAE